MTNRNARRAAILGSVVTVLLAGAVATAVRAGHRQRRHPVGPEPASQTYQVSSPTYSWTCC